MAQAAMAGSGGNAGAHAKASNNSAVKAQLQMQNAQQSNAAAAGNHGAARYSSPTDVASTAKTNGTTQQPAVTTTNGVVENAASQSSLKHDSGLATDWSNEEQSILEEALNK